VAFIKGTVFHVVPGNLSLLLTLSIKILQCWQIGIVKFYGTGFPMFHYEIMTFEMSVIQYYVFYSQESYKKSNWIVLMKSITASNSLPCQFHYFSIAREDLSQERSITAAPYNHHLK